VTNEGESADFADFNHKLVVMATSLEQSEKEFRSVIYYQIPAIW